MKIVAVVVTYFPEKEVVNNIKQYAENVDLLIVWENTPIVHRSHYQLDLTFLHTPVIYMGTDKNEGIAYALNRVVEYAVKHQYTYLLTMDQDSWWVDFEQYKEEIRHYENADYIGVFSPSINVKKKDEQGIREIQECITSGSVYRLKMFRLTGLFREDYFIDGIDIEFCYRARSFGYAVVCVNRSLLLQQFGQQSRSCLGCTITNYSAIRTYYIVRNMFFIWKEYPHLFTGKKFLINHYILIRILTVFFDERYKIQKYKLLIKGLIEGLFSSKYRNSKYILKC